jgi:sucrose-phosphate synthase
VYVLMLSLHGLVRGHAPELGRDADTGGQTAYVLELARALGRHSAISRVELVTRLVEDDSVSADYAQPFEILGPKAGLVRLPFGPRGYVRKELLWDHLDELTDRLLAKFRRSGSIPDVVHAHYADAGHVGRQLSQLLGIPLVFTGHSLGRCKRARLLEAGTREAVLERRFRISRRIEAEELVFDQAALAFASSKQERDEQYGIYEAFAPRRIAVVPPGIDPLRFSAAARRESAARVAPEIDRFLRHPGKPLLLAVSRPDEQKNLHGLLEAYATTPTLRDRANLAVVAGNRDDIERMDDGAKDVLKRLLLDIDRYDLYGSVAIPKTHRREDIPGFYQLAADRRGVFVNTCFSENFGLTLVEAAASGLPVVATRNGGAKQVVEDCRNGLLVDPVDTAGVGRAILNAIAEPRRWASWQRSGQRAVERRYCWDAHARAYIKRVGAIVRARRKERRKALAAAAAGRVPLLAAEYVLLADIDNTLLGDRESLRRLLAWLEEHRGRVAFGVATGRTLASARQVLRRWGVPSPDLLIASVGTEIYYGPRLLADDAWTRHIARHWRRDALVDALSGVDGLSPQPAANLTAFKVSYDVESARSEPLAHVRAVLRERGLRARLVYSHGSFLDVLPVRASKGRAVRYLSYRWGMPLDRFLVAGDSGNDECMLRGDTLGVVVGNHSPELDVLRGRRSVYFAAEPCAAGILEGIAAYGFAADELTAPMRVASQALATDRALGVAG